MADAVAGASPDDLASLGRTLGTTLAAIGRHGFAASGILDANLRVQPWPEPMAAFLRRCLSEGKGAARLDAAARDAAIDFAQAQCGVLTTLFADCRLVHGDFGMANILLTRQAESWRVVAVLDWEFCHAGTPMTDIGTLLRGKPGRSPEFEEAFANAFRDHGGILPERWRHLVRFLDLVTLCDFLSRGSPPSGLAAYADALLAESAENWKNGL